MSADNGTVLRQRANGKYVLHNYFASNGYPDIDDPHGVEFDTVEEAVRKHEEDERGYPSEYGLSIRLPEPTAPKALKDFKPGERFELSDGGVGEFIRLRGNDSTFCMVRWPSTPAYLETLSRHGRYTPTDKTID